MKKQVLVSQLIEVEVDEAKFTPAFMEEFRGYLYAFKSLNDHLEHLAQLKARGLVDDFGDPFIEGYGQSSEMGIKMHAVPHSTETEIQP